MSDDESVQEAVRNLLHLTTCRCPDDYTARGRHEPNSVCDYYEDADVVARALGVDQQGIEP